MTIIDQPLSLSLLGNIKPFKIGSTETVTFVLKKGAETIIQETYDPGTSGVCEIDVKDILSGYLSYLFTQTADTYIQPNIAADFTATILGTDVTFRVIRAGVDMLADTPSNFLKANFLTWQPQVKPVTYSQPEFLTYYAVVACSAVLEATMPDNSKQTVTLASMVAGTAYTIPAQYAVISAKLGNAMPQYYDIYVKDGAGNRMSYIQRYYPAAAFSEQEQWILFENSLGSLDCFRAYGQEEFTGDHTHNIAEIDEVAEEYRVDTERKHKKNTGYLNEYDRKWLLDFFPSKKKYIYTGSSVRQIVVTESNVSYADKELPSNFDFTYKYADATPYLNITRDQNIPEDLNITLPDASSFTLPPRLNDFERLPMTEGALFPVQSPYAEKWGATTGGALAEFLKTYIGATSSGGSVGHTHANKALLDLLTVIDGYLKVNGGKINSGYADKAGSVDGNIISDNITSTFFTPDRLGSGFKIYVDESGKTHAVFDKLLIRDEFVANKLTVSDVASIGGQILLTVANMNCVKVEDLTDVYRCYFKTDSGTISNRFVVGDQAICQTYNGSGQKYYWRLVTAIGTDYIDLSKIDYEGTGIPSAGDEIIQCGNRTEDTSRQNALMLSAYGDGSPSLKQYVGINSYSFVDCEKTVISPSGNKFTGDFILETGESISTLLQIQENIIYSEVSSVRKETNENNNLLQNGSFTNNTLYWITVSNIRLFTVAGKLLSFNNNFYGDQNRLIEISKDGSIFNIHLKNIAIKQYNSYIAKPDKVLLADGTYSNPTCIISFRYKCISAGNLKVGFEGTPLYFEKTLAVTSEYTLLELSGIWDLTGDFLLSFDGEIMLYDLALRNDKMEDFQVFTNSKITQTSESIEALVEQVNTINNTIANAGWLTESDKVKIWAALTFGETNTTLESLFEVTANGIFLKSDHIDLTGKVSFSSLTTDFQSTYSNDLSNAQLSAKNGIAQQLGFTNYAQLVENALVGKTLISGGYVNTELINAEAIITDALLADKIKAITIETNKLIAKSGSRLGNLSVSSSGALIGANHIFEEQKQYSVLSDGSISDTDAFSKLIVNNIGNYSAFLLSINAPSGTYTIYLPSYDDLQTAIGQSINIGYGFSIKLVVPGIWKTMQNGSYTNNATFRITSKTNAQIWDNNFSTKSYIDISKGDVLDLYGVVVVESTSGTFGNPDFTATLGIDYYIKNVSQ